MPRRGLRRKGTKLVKVTPDEVKVDPGKLVAVEKFKAVMAPGGIGERKGVA